MPRIAVVTGSNKGIGFAIVRALCKNLESSDVVYLTSRNESLGHEAVKALEAEGLSPKYHQLDISDEESAKRLRDHLEKSHGGFDILVNNAGVLMRSENPPDKEMLERTLKINYFDTVKTYNILSPILRPHSRVVFLSSGLGHTSYRQLTDALKKCFKEVKTEDDVKKLMEKYLHDVQRGIYDKEGWTVDSFNGYGISKLGVIAVAKVLGEQLEPKKGILINSCTPGFVDTDLTRHRGHRTIDEGAVTPVYLCLLSSEVVDPQGSYFNADNRIEDFLRN